MPFIRDGLISTNRTNPANIKTAKPLENVKILEVGCGAGILTEVDNYFKLVSAANKMSANILITWFSNFSNWLEFMVMLQLSIPAEH